MPLCISSYGDENDKDISLAIKYAVKNGASVINISSGKKFSLREKWVIDALEYANSNNVLVTTSAGNDYTNLDNPKNYNYPNDTDENGVEIVDNLIKVGASTRFLSDSIFNYASNYGKKEVDVFAPGHDIFTSSSQNKNQKYKFVSGTSFARPVVSGIAALIFSYYPSITASEVKRIIMDSGVEYTFPVKTPTKEDKNRTTPFNELSKSGKIVNAYNALIMADSISKISNNRK